jgi:hypothetical protein
MLSKKNIPFEIHITTATITVEQVDLFVKVCVENEAKPLLIELSKGESISQPMFSKIIYENSLPKVLFISESYTQLLFTNNFHVKRVKIEIPSNLSDTFDNPQESSFEPYFEWHGKINYEYVERLNELCIKHSVHLSLNALKNDNSTRFITLREFQTRNIFEDRINQLILNLEEEGWFIGKQQAEYCIYDNCILMDKGWLPM